MAHLTKREREILSNLKKDPTISQEKLAEKMEISRSAVAVHISNLMRKGFVLGRGYILDERTDIVVIGKTWLEIKAQADEPRIDISYGGLGYLMALELSRQQLIPTLFTVLGQDETGDRIYEKLLQSGVNVQYIVRTTGYPTPKKLFVSKEGNELCQVIDYKKNYQLNKNAQKSRDDLLKSAKVVLLDSDIAEPEIDHVIGLSTEYDFFVTILGSSLNWWEQKELFQCSQAFLVCHDYELINFAGNFQKGVPESSFPVCHHIVNKGLAALIVVFGQNGLVLATKKETIFLPASPLKGTGTDINIIAGVAGGLASGYSFRLTTRRALGNSEVSY